MDTEAQMKAARAEEAGAAGGGAGSRPGSAGGEAGEMVPAEVNPELLKQMEEMVGCWWRWGWLLGVACGCGACAGGIGLASAPRAHPPHSVLLLVRGLDSCPAAAPRLELITLPPTPRSPPAGLPHGARHAGAVPQRRHGAGGGHWLAGGAPGRHRHRRAAADLQGEFQRFCCSAGRGRADAAALTLGEGVVQQPLHPPCSCSRLPLSLLRPCCPPAPAERPQEEALP